jgi:hypothetical protein
MDETHKNIERTLGGMVEVEKGRWERREASALLSQDGVIKVMSILKTHINKNVSLSDLTVQFIRRKRIVIYAALYMNLHKNKAGYGIQDAASIKMIIECIDTAMYASMRQALDGTTSRRFYSSLSQQVNMGNRDQNSGGMQGL